MYIKFPIQRWPSRHHAVWYEPLHFYFLAQQSRSGAFKVWLFNLVRYYYVAVENWRLSFVWNDMQNWIVLRNFRFLNLFLVNSKCMVFYSFTGVDNEVVLFGHRCVGTQMSFYAKLRTTVFSWWPLFWLLSVYLFTHLYILWIYVILFIPILFYLLLLKLVKLHFYQYRCRNYET